MFFNQYFAWYYPLVLILCLGPLFAAVILFWMFYADESKAGRGKLTLGVTLAIIAMFLHGTWDVIYIAIIYPEKYVYEGVGDADVEGHYRRQTKFDYFLGTSLEKMLLLGFLIYAYLAILFWAQMANK